MAKLKLQMSVTLDGFVGRTDGGQDWLAKNQDDAFKHFYQTEMLDQVDTLLMGRKMTTEFNAYWENIVLTQPASAGYPFAKKLVDLRKIVFSKTVQQIAGQNTTVNNGDLVSEVQKLKGMAGKDLLVYGGAGFVSSLIEHDLIDEYYFIVTPTAIGAGLSIFSGTTTLKLVKSRAFECGVVVNQYRPL